MKPNLILLVLEKLFYARIAFSQHINGWRISTIAGSAGRGSPSICLEIVSRYLRVMHYFNYVLYEPESTIYEPYYLTWFDSSCSKAGPYGEPLQYHQEELLDESNLSQYKEAKVGYLSGSWDSYNQGCDTIELPYNSSSSWLDEYEYYFAGCWGEDMVRHGYNDSFYEPYNGCLEKAVNADINGDRDASNHSFNEDLQHAYSDTQWPGFDFGFADGINENYLDRGWKETQPSYDDCWSETKLYESIFGHWPCLVQQDQESHTAPSH